jgi:LPXTG-motif cell wall-anchored protein
MKTKKVNRFLVMLLTISLLLLNIVTGVFAVEIDDVDPTAPPQSAEYRVMKVSPSPSGTYTSLDGYLTVTIVDHGGKSIDWSSNIPVYLVYVKGGPNGGTLYDYQPEGSNGANGLYIVGDYGVSHTSFYYKVDSTTSISGSKVWVDNSNAGGERPETLRITLYQNGSAIDTQDLVITDEADTFDFSFTGLAKFDSEGAAYAYTVGEADEDVPAGYARTQSGNTITNTLTGEPGLAISKMVANLTNDSPPAKLVAALVDEVVQYSVLVTNTGNITLTDVILTDDQAMIGGTANITGSGEVTWLESAEGLAMINLGDMEPGDVIEIIYDYVIVSDDLDREVIINTATARTILQQTPQAQSPLVMLTAMPVFTMMALQAVAAESPLEILEVSDAALVTVSETTLAMADISLTKQVENLTQGGSPAGLAGGVPGDAFRYTLVVTNTGSAHLSEIHLSDDRAVADTAVQNITAGTALSWLADGNKPVYLDLGDLAPGEQITLTYIYTTSAEDADQALQNTAFVQGVVTETLELENPTLVTDEAVAMIAVDFIPLTGEISTTAGAAAGALLLVTALVLYLMRRRYRQTESITD